MSTDTTTRRGLLRLATGTLAYGAGAAAVAGAGIAISEAKGAGSALFDQRLAAFHAANDLFVRTCNQPGGCPDEVTATLCHDAGDAYDEMIETPATTHAQVTAKLSALAIWSTDCVIPNNELQIITDEALAVLTQEGR